jgi:hypothetical protein
LAVETDYILVVMVTNDTTSAVLDTFRISKSYSSFRVLVQQLKEVCDARIKEDKAKKTTKTTTTVDVGPGPTENEQQQQIIKHCQMIYSMIDTQRTTYLGKVNYTYVKVLAQQRMEIINHVVAILLNQCYPSVTNQETEVAAAAAAAVTTTTGSSFFNNIANIIQSFFLTDHVVCNDPPPPAASVPPVVGTDTTTDPTSSNDSSSSKNNSNNSNPLLWIGDAVKHVATNVVTTTQTSLQPILGGGAAAAAVPKINENTEDTTGTPTDVSVDTSTTTQPHMVVPMSQRNRRSILERGTEEETLRQVAGQEAKLVIEDELVSSSSSHGGTHHHPKPKVPNYLQPVPTVRFSSISTMGKWVDHNPWSFLVLAMVIVVALQYASKIAMDIDFDIFLLCIFGSFCIGLHTPRPMILGYDNIPSAIGNIPQLQTKKVDRSGRLLLRQSMSKTMIHPTTVQPRSQQHLFKVDEVSPMEDAVDKATVRDTDGTSTSPALLGSPMAMFPEGAELGSHLNCWSRPDPSIFQVRGPNYLIDKKKIPSSSEYIFPCRGLDLFLTDACPQNVGQQYSNILMGGKLREIPTFIINFRLPWGILLFYCEIPTKFIPFLDASTLYGTDEYKELVSTKLQSQLNDMTPGDRTVARWCMNDSEYKNKTLKIVPVVVDGPWVVKSVVGGKPAIIGAKLPISYVYQPSSSSSSSSDDDDDHHQALYLEADLDIAASSAARGILSVARSYTQILTLNLGFVIQANEPDELPEQMLTGARLHGIDPLTAPSLPSIQDDILAASHQLSTVTTSTDEESE